MTEMEKVIKAFEFCLMPPSREELENDICSHEDCPYYREYNGGKCVSAAAADALALLKSQVPMKPVMSEEKYGDALDHCPLCERALPNGGEYGKSYYCYKCGQAVKWE